MASSVVSSATIASINRASPAQASMVAPFSGLKSTSAFPVTRKLNNDITSIASNGGKVQCSESYYKDSGDFRSGLRSEKRSLRLSYLPDLTPQQLHGFVYRENHRSPGYYDGRYWTMWKLPMLGCTNASQVLKELEEAKEYPNAFIRIIGFDNKRQVQCISFIAYKPPGY
ncbi:hypothetical protein DITRI_Ditri17bG0045500 [Diplodiscus trichospermus]